MKRALRTIVVVVGFFCTCAALVVPTIASADEGPIPLKQPK
jgi:hypothetical protein